MILSNIMNLWFMVWTMVPNVAGFREFLRCEEFIKSIFFLKNARIWQTSLLKQILLNS